MPEVDPVILQLRADNRRYIAELRNTTRVAETSLGRQEKSIKSLENTATRGFRGAAGALVGYLGVVGSLGAAREFLRIADSAKQIEAQLKLATRETGNFAQAQSDVRQIASATRSDLESTAQLYATFQRNARELGITQQQAARATETVTKAFQISGATAAEAAGGLRQFLQGLQSGTLRGEELNSVLENAPRLARLLADSLGVTIGQLRLMGAEGELSADRLVAALTERRFTDQIDSEFRELPVTFDQAMTQVKNTATIVFGAFDRGGQFSTALANFITQGTGGFAGLEKSAMAFGATISSEMAGIAKIFSNVIGELNKFKAALDGITGGSFSGALSNATRDVGSLIVGGPIWPLLRASPEFRQGKQARQDELFRTPGNRPLEFMLEAMGQAGRMGNIARPSSPATKKGSAGRKGGGRSAAADAERERIRAIRDNAARLREEARLQDELIAVRASLATTAADVLQFQLHMNDRDREARLADLQTQLDLKEIGEQEFAARQRTVDLIHAGNEERLRRDNEEAQARLDALSARDEIDTLKAEADLVETREARRDAEKRILDLAYAEEEAAIRRAAANGEIADLDEALARLRRRQLADNESLARAHESPLQSYARRMDRRNFRDDAERLVIEEIEHVRDGISSAISKAIGTKDPLIAGLINLLVEQLLIQPMVRALANAGGGGLLGGILGGIGSVFGVGRRATGGRVMAGRPYVVGEHGPETMVPDSNGVVVPNHRQAAGSGRAVTVVQNIRVDARNSVNPDGFERRILTISQQMAQEAYTSALRDGPVLEAKRRRYG